MSEREKRRTKPKSRRKQKAARRPAPASDAKIIFDVDFPGLPSLIRSSSLHTSVIPMPPPAQQEISLLAAGLSVAADGNSSAGGRERTAFQSTLSTASAFPSGEVSIGIGNDAPFEIEP